MASTPAPAPRRSASARRPLPQPADGAMASTSGPRRSAKARGPLQQQPADGAMPPTPVRRRPARARRALPQPADRAAASARRRSARGPAAQTTVLPDEIWEEFLLRLDAAADLARASAACSTFRRIVSDGRFLRRFRSLRPPTVLGLIYICTGGHGFIPVDPPHRSAPEARALQRAADFTFSFIAEPSRSWCFRHALDGRVLLSRPIISKEIQFEDFLVCDPLHRRYVMIPRIPEDLMASTARAGTSPLLPVLAPAPAAENDGEESFRVICTVHLQLENKVMAFVFSSFNQTWRAVVSTICLPDASIPYMPYYAHGCLYWMFICMRYSLMIDASQMEFSIIDLPPHDVRSERAIVEAEGGRLGFLTIADGTIDLYCKNWRRNSVGAQQWQHDKLIPLPKHSGVNYGWEIHGTTGRYLALVAYDGIWDVVLPNSQQFVLDMKTLLVEKLCTSNNDMLYVFPYTGFPPPLALPSI